MAKSFTSLIAVLKQDDNKICPLNQIISVKELLCKEIDTLSQKRRGTDKIVKLPNPYRSISF